MGVVQNAIDIKALGEALAGVGSDLVSVKEKSDHAVLWADSRGYVGKNLLKNLATSKTYLGVGYTVNADKSISLTEATRAEYEGGLNFYPASGYTEHLIPEGKYILSDGGAGTTGAYLFFAKKKGPNGTPVYTSVIGEKEITIDYSEYDYFSFSIHVNNGYTVPAGGLTFYPMLRLASVADSTYEPYLPTNNELLQIETLKSITAAAADFAAFKTAIAAL